MRWCGSMICNGRIRKPTSRLGTELCPLPPMDSWLAAWNLDQAAVCGPACGDRFLIRQTGYLCEAGHKPWRDRLWRSSARAGPQTVDSRWPPPWRGR